MEEGLLLYTSGILQMEMVGPVCGPHYVWELKVYSKNCDLYLYVLHLLPFCHAFHRFLMKL